MFRRVVVAAVIAATLTTQVSAAWYIWYRKCPDGWKRYRSGYRTYRQADYIARKYKRYFPNAQVTTNSRTPPGKNPCRNSGGNRGATNRTGYGIYVANCRSANPTWQLVGVQDDKYFFNKTLAIQTAQQWTNAEGGRLHYSVGKINVSSDGRSWTAKQTPQAFGIAPCNGKKGGGGDDGGGGGGGGGYNPPPTPNPPSRPQECWVALYRGDHIDLPRGLDAKQAYCMGVRYMRKYPSYGFHTVRSCDGTIQQPLPVPFKAWAVVWYDPYKGKWDYYRGQLVNRQVSHVCSQSLANQRYNEVLSIYVNNFRLSMSRAKKYVRITSTMVDGARYECKGGYIYGRRALCN